MTNLNIEALSSQIDFMSPPPPGVECECDGDDGEHFHVRYMCAFCDVCKLSEIEADFFVYTREQGLHALAEYARTLGWIVDEKKNLYTCGECKTIGL